MKLCTTCHVEKATSEFHIRFAGQPERGLANRCKSCSKEATARYRAAHPERVKEATKLRRAANRDKYNAQAREYNAKPESKARVKAWNEANRDRFPAYNAQSRTRKYWDRMEATYGINRRAYEQFWSDQNGRCPICGTSLDETHIHIDHCHVSGQVRGLLCVSCNLGLGQFKESQHILARAATYLRGAYLP